MPGVSDARLDGFRAFLRTAPLKRVDSDNLLFFLGFVRGRHDAGLASRTFAIVGASGIGKTFLMSKLLKAVDIPVVFVGCTAPKVRSLVLRKNLHSVVSELRKQSKCLVALDDVDYLTTKDFADFLRNANEAADEQAVMFG